MRALWFYNRFWFHNIVMQSYTKCSDVRVNLMVTSMFLFMAGEILNFFVQMEIIIGAHKQILDLHSPCKEYSLCTDCLYIYIYIYIHTHTEYRNRKGWCSFDHVPTWDTIWGSWNQCGWRVQPLKKLDYILQSDYKYFCHHHQSEKELVDEFLCGLLHKTNHV